MLEKLLSLLLHAKGGTLATVLVLGASGALVTATVDNGMTTVTITQASPSPDGSAATTPNGSATTTTTTTIAVDQAILALFTRTQAEDDPTSTATGKDCSDEAHTMNAEIKAVNAAFKTDRQAVEALSKDAPRTDAAKKLVKDADKAIKDIRHAALKAIHATLSPSVTCHNDDDEDVDEDEDNEDEDDNDNEDEDEDNNEDNNEDDDSTSTTTALAVAFSGADPKAIADLAISAMDLQVTNLKATLAALPPTTTNTTNTTKSDSNRSNNDKHENKGDNKGKGGDKGDHEDDD